MKQLSCLLLSLAMIVCGVPALFMSVSASREYLFRTFGSRACIQPWDSERLGRYPVPATDLTGVHPAIGDWPLSISKKLQGGVSTEVYRLEITPVRNAPLLLDLTVSSASQENANCFAEWLSRRFVASLTDSYRTHGVPTDFDEGVAATPHNAPHLWGTAEPTELDLQSETVFAVYRASFSLLTICGGIVLFRNRRRITS
jgi:hypothetical protein